MCRSVHAGTGVVTINGSGGGPVATCACAGTRPLTPWWWWRSCCSVRAGSWVIAVDGSGSGRIAMCMWAGAGLSMPVVVMVVAACGHASRHSVVDTGGHGGSMCAGAGVIVVMVVVVSQCACALIVVVVVCPCSGTGCPGTSSLLLLLSVLAA